MVTPHLFQSPRLGFRNWTDADLPAFSRMNADPEVMEFFPAIATPAQTKTLADRMQKMYDDNGFCYFAVDRLEDDALIGFIGLCEQTYEAPFTPCVDIGWRLATKYWGKGYATEGAKRCLEYAFNELGLDTVKSVASVINTKSIQVMKKIGMQKELHFQHPKLINDVRLADCVCYSIAKSDLV